MPLACAHPNCHTLAYAFRSRGQVTPLTRFIDAKNHLNLLANGITFNRGRARQLIESYLGSLGCCAGGACDGDEQTDNQTFANGAADRRARRHQWPRGAPDSPAAGPSIADEFFARALAENLTSADVFRITITSFLDAYNFDVRRLMKCCIHHVLPSGHVIPFCAYNVLYRDGHVPLPILSRAHAPPPMPAATARQRLLSHPPTRNRRASRISRTPRSCSWRC